MDPQPTSLICPRCGKLISGYLEECSHCGLARPSRKQKWAIFLGQGGSVIRPIIGLCVLLFGLSYLLPLLSSSIPASQGSGFLKLLPAPSSAALAVLGWADPRAILEGRWYLLVTAIFLHGGFLHIIFNLLWVRDLGTQAEALLSPKVMFLVFVLTGAAGNLLAVFWPVIANSIGFRTQFAPVVGASGAVFGLMGVIMSFAPRGAGYMGLGLSRQMGKWALVMIALGFLMPGISNTAHIGGFISGWLLGKIIPVRSGVWAFELAGVGAMGLVFYSFSAQFYQAYLWLR